MDELAGTWLQDGQVVATISDDIICWVDGPTAKLTRHGTGKISVSLNSTDDSVATLDEKGSLVWSDGDVWVTAQSVEASCRRAAHKRRSFADTFHREADRRDHSREGAVAPRSGTRSRWERCGGSGGAGGAFAWNEGDQKIMRAGGFADRKKGVESALLPREVDHMYEIPVGFYGACYFQNMASFGSEGMHWGPGVIEKSPDDMVTRLLVTDSNPSILCIELNSLATYNMMDPILSGDLNWTCDVIQRHIMRTPNRGHTPLAIQVQGAGPHFCPGGNPNFGSQLAQFANLGPFDRCQYLGYAPFARIRDLAVPAVQGSHGAQVGGGNAYALNHTVRACAHTTTISFGNVSRGAVPGMILSQTLPTTIGQAKASALYLLDLTFSAGGANKADFMTRIFNGPREAKAGASEIAKSLAANPGGFRANRMIYPFEPERFCMEGNSIDFAGRGGGMFQNVKEKKVFSVALDLEDDVNQRGGRRRARALGRLAAKAGAVHAYGMEGGILSISEYAANCCWASMVAEAKLQGNKEHPAHYASEAAKLLHKPVHDLAAQNLGVWQSPANKRGMRKVDVWQIAEVVAFCLWRDRDFSIDVLDVKAEAPLSQLQDGDFRKSLFKTRLAIDADVAVPAITVNHRSSNSMHFEDPVKRLGGRSQADSWWQLISVDAGRHASMLLLAALLGAAADPRVLLTCEGEEVYDFSLCRGKYMGAVKQLAVKDVSSGSGQISLVPKSDSKHDWIAIQTVSGRETCIDIAAAQFGDMTRSECSGVPVVFASADQFKKSYLEQRRDHNPLMTYSEEFSNMANARVKEGPGRIEEFFSVLGKACALLGLV